MVQEGYSKVSNNNETPTFLFFSLIDKEQYKVERHKHTNKVWRNNNKERKRIYDIEYQRKNAEIYRLSSKLYKLKHPDLIKKQNHESHLRYYARHKEEVKNDNRTSTHKERLISLLGATCSKCGYNMNILGLDLHHKNHDGRVDRTRFNTYMQLLRYYINNIEEAKARLEVLCVICHRIDTSNYMHIIASQRCPQSLKELRVNLMEYENTS